MDHSLDDLLPGLLDLSDDDVAEFQRLVKNEVGVDLSPGEARLQAQELIRLVSMISRPTKPATAVTPVAGKPSEDWDHLLGRLQTFAQSLLHIRPHSKDWIWSLREARALLTGVFALRLQQPLKPKSRQTLGYDPLLTPLPKLLVDLRDRMRTALPLRTTNVVSLLERLDHEATMMTVGGWTLLSRDLPRLFLDLIVIVRSLIFPENAESGAPPEYSRAIARELESIEHRLLLLEAEGREQLIRPPR